MRPRKLLRIARWEITKGAEVPNRETLAVVVLTVALVALVGPLAVLSGVGLEDGLYRVGVDETSPYYEVAAAEETFVVVAGADREQLTAGGVDLLVDDGRLRSADTDKGAAARETFRDAVTRYNERQLRLEPTGVLRFRSRSHSSSGSRVVSPNSSVPGPVTVPARLRTAMTTPTAKRLTAATTPEVAPTVVTRPTAQPTAEIPTARPIAEIPIVPTTDRTAR